MRELYADSESQQQISQQKRQLIPTLLGLLEVDLKPEIAEAIGLNQETRWLLVRGRFRGSIC